MRTLTIVTLAALSVAPLKAQPAESPSSLRLTIDPATILQSARMPSPPPREDTAASPAPTHVALPPVIDNLLTTLTARSEMRTADVIVGAGLMAWNSRSRHSLSSVAGVGAQAIRLALRPRDASRPRHVDIRPEVDRDGTRLSIQYQW